MAAVLTSPQSLGNEEAINELEGQKRMWASEKLKAQHGLGRIQAEIVNRQLNPYAPSNALKDLYKAQDSIQGVYDKAKSLIKALENKIEVQKAP
jgi:hypothetical protein